MIGKSILLVILLAAFLVPVQVAGCTPAPVVYRQGTNEEMNTQRPENTHIATFALG